MTASSLSDQASHPAPELAVRRLDPTALSDHIETLNRVAALYVAHAMTRKTSFKTPRKGAGDSEPGAGSSLVFTATELMTAIAGAPQPYRDAVLAVDVVGLSYQQAARCLGACEATITSRLSRGRQHVARALVDSSALERGSPSNATASSIAHRGVT